MLRVAKLLLSLTVFKKRHHTSGCDLNRFVYCRFSLYKFISNSINIRRHAHKIIVVTLLIVQYPREIIFTVISYRQPSYDIKCRLLINNLKFSVEP